MSVPRPVTKHIHSTDSESMYKAKSEMKEPPDTCDVCGRGPAANEQRRGPVRPPRPRPQPSRRCEALQVEILGSGIPLRVGMGRRYQGRGACGKGVREGLKGRGHKGP